MELWATLEAQFDRHWYKKAHPNKQKVIGNQQRRGTRLQQSTRTTTGSNSEEMETQNSVKDPVAFSVVSDHCEQRFTQSHPPSTKDK